MSQLKSGRKNTQRPSEFTLTLPANRDLDNDAANIDLYQTVHKLLDAIQYIMVPQDKHKEIAEPDMNKVNDIECLSEGQPLSMDNPLRFKFLHPDLEGAICIASMKEGSPTLAIELLNGMITETTVQDLVRKAAIKYREKKVNQELLQHMNKIHDQANAQTIGAPSTPRVAEERGFEPRTRY